MDRRKFLQNMALFGGAAVVAGSGLVYTVEAASYAVEVVQLRVPMVGLHPGMRGLRVAQISDLHLGLWVSRAQLEDVVKLLLQQEPDIVFLTGDVLTFGGDITRALADAEAVLGKLAERVPVYAVLGNHDHNTEDAKARLKALYLRIGIHLLINEVLPYRRSEGVLYLAGMDSITEGYSGLREIAQNLPADGPAILLVHEPDIADMVAETGKFAMQFSGHSHGGQVNLPLVGRLILPWMGRKYPAGLYHIKNMLLYTNRGIGMFHLRARVNCPPEITIFTFAAAGE